VIKTKRTKAEWAELLKRQEASGEGVREWCAENGVNVSSMYNQIGRRRKGQGKSERRQTSKQALEDTKAVSHAAKLEAVEWKEINITSEWQREGAQRGSVYIEIGSMRMAADAGYPVRNLAALCKGLIRTC